MVEEASTFETSVNFFQITRRNNFEDSHLHPAILFASPIQLTDRNESLKSSLRSSTDTVTLS
jgi:hypothetical protein